MSTLIAFLHHLAAFTLVSAIAVEFALIRQELTNTKSRDILNSYGSMFGDDRQSRNAEMKSNTWTGVANAWTNNDAGGR